MLELLRGRSKVTDSSRVASSIVLNDRELLVRFLAGDEAAFSELVQRHSGLVWGACQRILRNAEDADDAFQATFLVLARKARSLQWQDSIAGWLLETARRTSLKLRAIAARRRKVEDLSMQQREKEASMSVDSPAIQASVHELASTPAIASRSHINGGNSCCLVGAGNCNCGGYDDACRFNDPGCGGICRYGFTGNRDNPCCRISCSGSSENDGFRKNQIHLNLYCVVINRRWNCLRHAAG